MDPVAQFENAVLALSRPESMAAADAFLQSARASPASLDVARQVLERSASADARAHGVLVIRDVATRTAAQLDSKESLRWVLIGRDFQVRSAERNEMNSHMTSFHLFLH